MSRESLVVRNRTEFDDFWISGIEFGQMQTLEALESVTKPASETDKLQTTTTVRLTNLLDDPPVTAQVWWKYATLPQDEPVDLLLDPTVSAGTGPQASRASSEIALRQIESFVIDGNVSLESTRLAEGFGFIALDLTYHTMVTRLLPLTSWLTFLEEAKQLTPTMRREAMRHYRKYKTAEWDAGRIGWFLHLLALCGHTAGGGPAEITYGARSPAMRMVDRLLADVQTPSQIRYVGRVTLNRPVKASVHRSSRTVKVDATRGLFGVRCDEIRWAVVDTGIDAVPQVVPRVAGRWHTVGRSVREQRHRLQLHPDRRGVRLQPPAHVRRARSRRQAWRGSASG